MFKDTNFKNHENKRIIFFEQFGNIFVITCIKRSTIKKKKASPLKFLIKNKRSL